jgi:hypothetical protein
MSRNAIRAKTGDFFRATNEQGARARRSRALLLAALLCWTVAHAVQKGLAQDLDGHYDAGRRFAEDMAGKMDEPGEVERKVVAPMTTETPMKTLDPAASPKMGLAAEFEGKVAEKGVREYLRLELFGERNNLVRVQQDLNALGAGGLEERWHTLEVPLPLSGVTAYGFISCSPAWSWRNCKYYRWATDEEGRVSYQSSGEEDTTAGGYCANESCGFVKNAASLERMASDLAGGVYAAVQRARPTVALSRVEVQGARVTCYAQEAADVRTEYSYPEYGSKAPAQYFDPEESARLEAAAARESSRQAADPASPYGIMDAAERNARGDLRDFECTVRRDVEVTEMALIDVIEPMEGVGQVLSCGDRCLQVVFGRLGDNYLSGWCTVYEMAQTFRVKRPEYVRSATLVRAVWDDYMRIWVAGRKVFDGPNGRFPPETGGECELSTSWDRWVDTDLSWAFGSAGDLDVLVKVSVAGEGEGYALVEVDLEELCREETTEDSDPVMNGCRALDEDPECALLEETVDSVVTMTGGKPTGNHPDPSTRLVGGAACERWARRTWWEKRRLYLCHGESNEADFTAAKERLRTVAGSTQFDAGELRYQDRRVEIETGRTVEEAHAAEIGLTLAGPDSCEQACKVRGPWKDTQAGSAEQIENYHSGQYRPTESTRVRYPRCVQGRCPAEPGEEIVQACGCLNEFGEAAAALFAIDKAAHDMVCVTR